MIELRDTIEIEAPPETVWAWLDSMPDHVLEWHPDHISARWVSGKGFVPGAVVEVRERLHGTPHRLRMTLTDVASGRWARYRVFPGLRGEFRIRPVGDGCEFTAVIEMGVTTPVLGSLLDGMLRVLLGRRIDAIRRHQAEEGINLKRLLERKPSVEP